MEKADFLYFEVEVPNGINLSSGIEAWHFLQKSEKNKNKKKQVCIE